jgi:general L-amino acid transport system substrate-binding protein
MRKSPASALAALMLFLLAGHAQAGARLDAIKARGFLVCGVGAHVPGFSVMDGSGQYRGFDADLCRAVAAGIFGNPAKVSFNPIDTVTNFLKAGDIDLVLRGLSWTFGREMNSQLRFGPIVLYDGQSFLAARRAGIAAIAQLSGKTICVSTDAEFLSTLRYYFRAHHLTLKAVVKDTRADAADAFFMGQCDALTADASELAESMIGKAPHPDDFVILPAELTKEPLAPLLRKGDEQFFDVVRWTIFALIDAEELGIDKGDIERMRMSDNPEVRQFFTPPQVPGLSRNWSYDAVKAAGNYGEIFDRNLGTGSLAKLARGPNRPWNAGGLMYAPPLR